MCFTELEAILRGFRILYDLFIFFYNKNVNNVCSPYTSNKFMSSISQITWMKKLKWSIATVLGSTLYSFTAHALCGSQIFKKSNPTQNPPGIYHCHSKKVKTPCLTSWGSTWSTFPAWHFASSSPLLWPLSVTSRGEVSLLIFFFFSYTYNSTSKHRTDTHKTNTFGQQSAYTGK